MEPKESVMPHNNIKKCISRFEALNNHLEIIGAKIYNPEIT